MSVNPMNLTGKKILVTGASSGIGRETAILLSDLGASVILLARNEERLLMTQNKLAGSNHGSYPFDLNQLEAIPDLIKKIVEEQGKLDGLFHAAGIEATIALKSIKANNITSVFDSSVFAGMMIAKSYSSKKVHSTGGGSMVFMSSVSGLTGSKALSIYGASKAAIDGMVRPMAVELSDKNIRVNSIAAGMVKTEMLQEVIEKSPEGAIPAKEKMHPLGFGEAKDVAMAAAFLLSDAAKWITGTTMVVDGGFTISR